MNNLSAFLSGNAKKIDLVEFVASKRFVEDDNPIAWKIGCITAKDNAKIRGECMIQTPVIGKKGHFTTSLDTAKYLARVCARCTIFPDLNSGELQNSYGVMSAEDLLTTMLTPGEFDDYSTKVLEVNGFDNDADELVEKAKN